MYIKKFTLHEHCHRNFTRGFTKSSQENPRNEENANSIVAFFWRLARLFHSRWSLGYILLSLWNICFNGENDQNFNYTTNQTFPILPCLPANAISRYDRNLSTLSLFQMLLKKTLTLKDTFSGLRQFLVTESPLKMIINAFYFTSKALFVLKIFKSLSWLFGHVSKQLDYKDKVHFKFYDVTAWLTINCNTHITQYLENKKQRDNEVWSFNRI